MTQAHSWNLTSEKGGGIGYIVISVTSNIIVMRKTKNGLSYLLVFHAARFCNTVQRPLRCFYCLYQGHCATSKYNIHASSTFSIITLYNMYNVYSQLSIDNVKIKFNYSIFVMLKMKMSRMPMITSRRCKYFSMETNTTCIEAIWEVLK